MTQSGVPISEMDPIAGALAGDEMELLLAIFSPCPC
jgi:hypothetical protein